MIIDQNVRQKVLDTTHSFLVQAPAGSGKTSLLVQRYLKLLAIVEEAPEEVIALTFTRKAAAEMRDRVIDALILGLSPERPNDDYNQQLWSLAQQVLQRDTHACWNLIDNPTRLKIQTIDGLCASITAQMPVLAQFGAQPKIESQPQILYAKAVDLLLQSAEQDVAWIQSLHYILEHLDNDRKKIRDLLIASLQIREQWLSLVFVKNSELNLREILELSLRITNEQAIADLHAAVPEFLDFDLLPEFDADAAAGWAKVAKTLLTEKQQWRVQVNKHQGFPAPSDAENKEERALFKARKEAMHRMLQQLAHCTTFKHQLCAVLQLPPLKYNDGQWQMLSSLLEILRVLAALFVTVCKDAGRIDFVGVSLAAIRALDAQDLATDLALALDCKIRHILVDEFQDTSNLQFQLLESLVASWQAGDGRTLFLVGDPMQSIYRFRKAEVELFLKAKQYGINGIPLNFVQLKVNFRSTAAVVQTINKIFSLSFPATDDMTYGAICYMPSVALDAQSAEPALKCIATDAVGEVQYIIDLINTIKNSDPIKTIAILVRSKTHLRQLLPALRNAQIAFQGVEIESLQRRALIQDLLALTRALLHLDDRIAWLAVLRAPWCGLTLADLHVFGQHPQPIWQSLNDANIISNLSTDGQLRIQCLIEAFNHSLTQRMRSSIELQVQELWQNLGGTANQESEAFFALLSEYATQRELFHTDFIEQQLKELYLPADTLNANAVQIMTMHKAKGLEFDVVILPSLAKRLRADDQKILFCETRAHPHAHILLAPIKAASQTQDAVYNYVAWSETKRQDYEELRLLYVAMTRARQQIYCLADIEPEKPVPKSPIAQIWPVVADGFVVLERPQTELSSKPTHMLHRVASSCLAKYNLSSTAISTVDIPNPQLQNDWLRVVGIVVHRIFYRIATDGVEHWPLERVMQQRLFWLQQLRQHGLLQEYIDSALELIEVAVTNTLNDSIGSKILSANHLESYAEWGLCKKINHEFQSMVLDRAFFTHEQQFWIVDYKIIKDTNEIPDAIAKYESQLQKYIHAVRMLYPQRNIVAGLYFPLQLKWEVLVLNRTTV